MEKSKVEPRVACRRSAAFVKACMWGTLALMGFVAVLVILVNLGLLKIDYRFEDGMYNFYYQGSDGIRSSFDGNLVFNKEVADPALAYNVFMLVCGLGLLIPIFVVLFFINRIMERVMKGESPFTFETERDLRRIACILILAGVFGENFIRFLVGAIGFHVFVLGMQISGAAVLSGIVAFILAEIFHYGCQLQEDVDETI